MSDGWIEIVTGGTLPGLNDDVDVTVELGDPIDMRWVERAVYVWGDGIGSGWGKFRVGSHDFKPPQYQNSQGFASAPARITAWRPVPEPFVKGKIAP